MTVTVTRTPQEFKTDRAPLRAALLEAGITHDDVAKAATCDRTLVVHFFAGRRTAEAVEKAARKLLARKERKVS